jgi:thymidine phosphorylase
MNPALLIARKRAGETLPATAIAELVGGVADGTLCDAQIGALAMAICLRGMDVDETRELTLRMRDSGRVIAWRGSQSLPGPIVDKHSTGGVGDVVSLVLAPVLAACGAFVPMISGRGLGHTGGTLDKLEAIPGYDCTPDPERFDRVVRECGLAIVAAGPDLVPADARLYAIRDRTGTVDSVALITASILSKKLAAGIATLLLDLKVGNGAWMADVGEGATLADSLLTVANVCGMRTTVALSDMNQPLADCAGNALEVIAALRVLRGEDLSSRLYDLSLAFAAELLCMSRLAKDSTEASTMARDALASGRAAERFERMQALLGGPHALLRNAERLLPSAACVLELRAGTSGVLGHVDTRALGEICVELGAGRRLASDRVDPAVGLSGIRSIGEHIASGETLAFVHARDEASARRALDRLPQAMQIVDSRAPMQPLIHAWRRSTGELR